MAQPRTIPSDTTLPSAFGRRSDFVRLRTLVLLRWIAITGQVITVTVAAAGLGLDLMMGLVTMTIGAAVLTNLMASLLFPENRRLSEPELLATLLFDMVQLSSLLFLTGGLNNPFALLILAQVTISATALRRNATRFLGTCAVLLITGLYFVHVPLVTTWGEILQLSPLFRTGFWIAIIVGVVFQASYARRVTAEVTAMSDALAATQMALAREQKLTDLGGIVAAAAHELGTPLATIALVSSELMQEAEPDSELAQDARLIREQAERCRRILHDMGQSEDGDDHLRTAPIASVIEHAAEPHSNRGIHLLYDMGPSAGTDDRQPVILRRPEIIHGLRNLIQNAVDFSETCVWLQARWTESHLSLQISDDGPGFPQDIIPRLGDPFMHRRPPASQTDRGAYRGMGLGLFIAKTLLERSGAEITFANGRDAFGAGIDDTGRTGAIVTLTWPRAVLEPGDPDSARQLRDR